MLSTKQSTVGYVSISCCSNLRAQAESTESGTPHLWNSHRNSWSDGIEVPSYALKYAAIFAVIVVVRGVGLVLLLKKLAKWQGCVLQVAKLVEHASVGGTDPPNGKGNG